MRQVSQQSAVTLTIKIALVLEGGAKLQQIVLDKLVHANLQLLQVQLMKRTCVLSL